MLVYPVWYYAPFLLIVLLVYWKTKNPHKKYLLAVSSILFLYTIISYALLVLIFLSSTVYLIQKLLLQNNPKEFKTKFIFYAMILGLVTYWFIFKYYLGTSSSLKNITFFLFGLSFFSFKFLHYIIDTYRGTIPKHDYCDFLLYIVFFPIFPIGPIERFQNFNRYTSNIQFSWKEFSYGIERILLGMSKKIILADFILGYILSYYDFELVGDRVAVSLDWVFQYKLSFNDYSYSSLIVFAYCLFLKLYFDFSGYSDIAIGTGRLFGYKIMENFKWPILQANPSDYWRCWHISLTSWVRDYIYFPVLGLTRHTKFSLVITMLAIAVRHNIEMQWIVWGIYNGIVLVVWHGYQKVKKRYKIYLWDKHPFYKVGAIFLTFNFVAFGRVISGTDHLFIGVAFFKRLLCLGM